MKVVNEELKKKFLSRINDNMTIYDALIKDVNKALLEYGSEFFGYTSGRVTESYIREHKENMLTGIGLASRKAFSDMSAALEQLKADYIIESYPADTTTDPLELSFVGKELEVMTSEELRAFYEENFNDANKVRLFDIEVKRRSRSDDQSRRTEGNWLSSVKEEFEIRDSVTEKIGERIKLVTGLRSFSGNVLYFLSIGEDGGVMTKLNPLSDIIRTVESRSRMAMPQQVDVYEMMGQGESA